jgi:hypothetical protein
MRPAAPFTIPGTLLSRLPNDDKWAVVRTSADYDGPCCSWDGATGQTIAVDAQGQWWRMPWPARPGDQWEAFRSFFSVLPNQPDLYIVWPSSEPPTP